MLTVQAGLTRLRTLDIPWFPVTVVVDFVAAGEGLLNYHWTPHCARLEAHFLAQVMTWKHLCALVDAVLLVGVS